jgi:hypothetical protein
VAVVPIDSWDQGGSNGSSFNDWVAVLSDLSAIAMPCSPLTQQKSKKITHFLIKKTPFSYEKIPIFL